MMYDLVDAQMQHKLHPETFYVPSDEALQSIAPGQHVKLGFKLNVLEQISNPGIDTERMWVRVTGSHTGILANDPVCKSMTAGESVEFELRHVMDIL